MTVILSDRELEAATLEMCEKIAGFVKQRRIDLKMSTYELAKRSGVNWWTLKKIESAKPSNINSVARVLRVLKGNILLM